MADATPNKPRAIVWLRNDLRVAENAVLSAAARLVADGTVSTVTPLYCFDPRTHGTLPAGFPKTGAHRCRFLLESVADLSTSLTALGSGLAVRVARPEAAIPALLGDTPGGIVLAVGEPCTEEVRVEAAVAEAARAAGGELRVIQGADTLLHPADASVGPGCERLPDQFTAFRTAVEARWRVRPPLPPPAKGALPPPPDAAAVFTPPPSSVEELTEILPADCPRLKAPVADPRAVLAFKGGETAALARLHHYLVGTRAASTYFDTRNGMLGPDYSTKFSPWLAAGCVSARTVAAELTRYEAEHGANKSTYWIVFELLWRDFFHFYARKHGAKLFYPFSTNGTRAPWVGSAASAAAWREGRTGRPLVDANMRELAATGFMSNRGRQNVASFLVHDLGVDWRVGAEWFESNLLDHDPASNYGNWAAVAFGLAPGARLNVFNIAKQSKDYDPAGDYVRHWLPELARVEGGAVHDPPSLSRDAAAAAGVTVGVDYPLPLKSVARAYGRFGGRGVGGGGSGRGGGHGGGGRSGGGRGGGGRGGRGRTGGRYGEGGHGGVPGREQRRG